jgi:acylphosphatase
MRRKAEALGVAGWVSNRPDGAVEAVFEGDAEAVESMVRFARRGPEGAVVDGVETTDENPEGVQGFSVR